jgi:hypothetical protein
MVWTQFWDMHSGGGTKEEPYEKIYIEAPEAEAKVIFFNRFGHNPERVSCTCCGEDYSVHEHPSLAEATGFQRNCNYAWFDADGNRMPEDFNPRSLSPSRRYDVAHEHGYEQRIVEEPDPIKAGYRTMQYETLEDYLKHPDVLVIPEAEIKPEEREGDVPQQGYVWMD